MTVTKGKSADRRKTFWDALGGIGGTKADSMSTVVNSGAGTLGDNMRAFYSSKLAGGNWKDGKRAFGVRVVGDSIIDQLVNTDNLTFAKIYKENSLDANFSTGSPAGTFTSARDATKPATYVDASGVIQKVTTADVPRYAGGYYDATGFHSAQGLLVEAAGTNLLLYSDGTTYGATTGGTKWNSWILAGFNAQVTGTVVLSNTLIPELTSISGSTSQRVQYTGIVTDATKDSRFSYNTTVGSFTDGDTATTSIWMRSLTGNVGVTVKLIHQWRNVVATVQTNRSANLVASLTTSWRKFTLTSTLVVTGDNLISGVVVEAVDNTDTIDYEIALPQTEKLPYPTSFIPTTTAALTRPAEILKYETADNRTAATETIAIKFMPLGGSFANDAIIRCLLDSDTKVNSIRKIAAGAKINYYPNLTDSATTDPISATTVALNTSYVATGVAYGEAAATNAEIYINGISEGTDTTDYTAPAWGTNFEVGSSTAGANQLNGLIQAIAIYNRALTAPEVLAVYNIMK